jgi:hypothetical protein
LGLDRFARAACAFPADFPAPDFDTTGFDARLERTACGEAAGGGA